MKPIVLHVLTKPEDAWARRLMALEEEQGGGPTVVVDLVMDPPDYDALLDHIMNADSIQVW